MKDFESQWIIPFYRLILGGHYRLSHPAFNECRTIMHDGYQSIDNDILHQLLLSQEWRGLLVGSWFVGLTKNKEHYNQIASDLIKIDMPFCLEGYVFAVLRFMSSELALSLIGYIRSINQHSYHSIAAYAGLIIMENELNLDLISGKEMQNYREEISKRNCGALIDDKVIQLNEMLAFASKFD